MNYTWTHIDHETTLDTTTEGIRAACSVLGVYPDQLADLLTGYDCDSYADTTEELLEDSGGDIDAAIEYYTDTYNRCRVYHRIMNIALDDDTCEECWLQDFKRTAE